jgi:two-component system response regulator VicR
MCEVILARAGYEVKLAFDGEQALDIALEERPALIITDYNMPVRNGMSFCREILHHYEDVKIVMVSGFACSVPEGSGVVEFIKKPFPILNLLSCVEKHISKHSEQVDQDIIAAMNIKPR